MALNRKKYSVLLQITFVLFLFINTIKTDLPVHCLLNDVHGLWDFIISEKTFTPSLENEEQTSCGHGVPNKVVEITDNNKIDIPNFKKISVDLRPNFDVYENGKKVGSWTFVYDQSLLIKYNSAVLTAPFKYYKHQGSSSAESNCSKTFLGWYIPRNLDIGRDWSCFYGLKQGKTVEKKEFTGFLEVKGSTREERHENIGEFLENSIAKELKLTKAEAMRTPDFGFSFVQTGVTNRATIENNLKYEQMGKVISKINSLNLGWEADINPKYIGMSFAQVKNQLGLNKGNYNSQKNKSDKFSFIQMTKELTESTIDEYLRSVEKEIDGIEKANRTIMLQTQEKVIGKTEENSKQKSSSKLRSKENSKLNVENEDETCSNCVPKIHIDTSNPTKTKTVKPDAERENDSEMVTSYQEVAKYINHDIEEIDETKLPKNWDWRNVGGASFLPPVRNQGNCGSCYVFSTMTSLESRLRVQTNNQDKTLFSKQYPLSCNFYSEGCDGGYPTLVAKFSREFELVPEDCFEYTQSNDSCKKVCKDFKSNPKKYSVSDYGYLGGAYGKTTEAQMMKEIRARGPIPGNILVHWSFQYYKHGIFSTQKLMRNSRVINQKDLFDYGLSWAKVEHSITIVGYGEEDGTKYWIGMNTWGEDWGDNGFFKILRGENEAMIESMGDYMNIKVEHRK